MEQTRVGIRNGSLFNNNSTLWNNLLAYYKGDGTPDDALGNYNGTLVNGATYGTGIINQGFSFDGVNDYVNFGVVPAFNFGTGDFTISIWVYWTVNSSYDAIFSIAGYKNHAGGFSLYATTPQKLELWYKYSASSYAKIGSTPDNSLVINTWNHVVLRRSGNNIDIFINNTKYNLSTTFTDSLGNSTGNTRLGDNEFSLFYIGRLDEFAPFNVAKSDSEVTELYNSGSGKQYPN